MTAVVRLPGWDDVSVSGPDLPKLTTAELAQLFELLARYGSHDLDQFDHWSLNLWWGTAYVEVSMEPRLDVSEEIYTRVWPLPDKVLRDLGGDSQQ